MIGKTLTDQLHAFCTSSQYNQPIKVNSKFPCTNFNEVKYDYERLSNPIQILPPSVWFIIQQGKCLSEIQNEIQKSIKSKQGFLLSSGKGNSLNQIIPFHNEQDIGLIQDNQNCLCISYGILKQKGQQFFKHIGAQLRACLIKKFNIFESQNIQTGALDEITKQIYRKYRIFLAFDSYSQPGKVISYHSCFYPNIRFVIQKIKTKDNIKYAPNEVFQAIKEGRLNNSFGYLSLDNKKRFLMIKKDDPQFSNQFLTGVWIIGSFPLKRTRKQFGKQDAIWQALFDFYSNREAIKKTSTMADNKGIICYFSTNKQNFKPQFYIFSLDNKVQPKWSFISKSEYITDWNRPYQIKFDFINTTIIQEREYSEFSDQTNVQEIKQKNENINRENIQCEKNKIKPKEIIKPKSDSDPKDYQIAKLKEELQQYKKKCLELQAMNKVLMQEKMMNQMIYQQPYFNQMMQIPNYPSMQYHQNQSHQQQVYYPFSQTQVTSIVNQKDQTSQKKGLNNSQKLPTSPKASLNNEQHEEGQKIYNQQLKYAFEEEDKGIITFEQKKTEQNRRKYQNTQQKPFIKKKLSQQQNSLVKKQSKTLKTNSEAINEIFVRPDAKNISFQDSFMEYHSDRDKDNQESSQQDMKNKQYQQKANIHSDSEPQQVRSPEFKRFISQGEENTFNKKEFSSIHKNNLASAFENEQKEVKNFEDQLKSQPIPEKTVSIEVKKNHSNLFKKYQIDAPSDEDESAYNSAKKKTAKPPKKPKYSKYSESQDSDQGEIIKNIKNKYLYTK